MNQISPNRPSRFALRSPTAAQDDEIAAVGKALIGIRQAISEAPDTEDVREALFQTKDILEEQLLLLSARTLEGIGVKLQAAYHHMDQRPDSLIPTAPESGGDIDLHLVWSALSDIGVAGSQVDPDAELKRLWAEAVQLEHEFEHVPFSGTEEERQLQYEHVSAAMKAAFAADAHTAAGLAIKLQQVMMAWEENYIIEKRGDLISTALFAAERLAPRSVIYRPSVDGTSDDLAILAGMSSGARTDGNPDGELLALGDEYLAAAAAIRDWPGEYDPPEEVLQRREAAMDRVFGLPATTAGGVAVQMMICREMAAVDSAWEKRLRSLEKRAQEIGSGRKGVSAPRIDEPVQEAFNRFLQLNLNEAIPEEDQGPAVDAWRKLERDAWRVAATSPARSIADIAVKAQLLAMEVEDGASEFKDDIIRTLFAGFEQLAPGCIQYQSPARTEE